MSVARREGILRHHVSAGRQTAIDAVMRSSGLSIEGSNEAIAFRSRDGSVEKSRPCRPPSPLGDHERMCKVERFLNSCSPTLQNGTSPVKSPQSLPRTMEESQRLCQTQAGELSYGHSGVRSHDDAASDLYDTPPTVKQHSPSASTPHLDLLQESISSGESPLLEAVRRKQAAYGSSPGKALASVRFAEMLAGCCPPTNDACGTDGETAREHGAACLPCAHMQRRHSTASDSVDLVCCQRVCIGYGGLKHVQSLKMHAQTLRRRGAHS